MRSRALHAPADPIGAWRFVLLAGTLAHATGCGDAAEQTTATTTTTTASSSSTSCAPGELEIGSGCLPAGMQDNGCAAGETPLASGGCLAAGETESGCEPGTRAVGDACVPAGTQDDGCAAGELADAEGTCVAAGVPPDRCAAGFVADGDGGCDVVLPADPCPGGQVALPGETTCHAIAACGNAPWGTVPVEASTQYVDAAYPGADSDGSSAKPWTTIQAAVDAAASGAIVAIAAGSYGEEVDVGPKPVRLWGRCPELVEIAPSGTGYAAVEIHDTTGAEVHDLAVRSDAIAVAIDASATVAVERVWIHEIASTAVQVVSSTGVTVEGSLVEQSFDTAIAAYGSQLDVSATVVRDTVATEPNAGRGLTATFWDGARSDVAVHGSLFQSTRDLAIVAFGSDALVEDTAVLDTQWEDTYGADGVVAIATTDGGRGAVTVRGSLIRGTHDGGVQAFGSDALVETTTIVGVGALPQGSGDGVYLIDIEEGGRANATLRASTLRDAPGAGVTAYGSDLALEAVLVRGTKATSDGGGDGIYLEEHGTDRTVATIAGSFFDANAQIGILAFGSDLDVEGTAVRGTKTTSAFAWGVGLLPEGTDPSKASMRACSIESATRVGVAVLASQADIEGTRIHATRSVQGGAHGLHVESDEETAARSDLTLRTSRLDGNEGGGLAVFGSDATVVDTAIVDSLPGDQGTFGRGISVEDSPQAGRGALDVASSVVRDSHEAGLSVTGSDATVTGSVIEGTQLDPAPVTNTVAAVVAQTGVANDPAKVTLVGSRLERNAGGGITVFASEATVDGCIVRDTTSGYDDLYGRGVTVQSTEPDDPRARATIRSSVFDGTADSGIAAYNADLTVEAVVVRHTTATFAYGILGIGVFVVTDGEPGTAPVNAVIHGSVVEDTFNVGILAKLANVDVQTVLVRRTLPGPDGAYGDGLCVLSLGEGSATVARSRIEDSARAGITNFASSVSIRDTTLECNPIALDGESELGPSAFHDDGGNVCGCEGATVECKVLSSTLAPPTTPPAQER